MTLNDDWYNCLVIVSLSLLCLSFIICFFGVTALICIICVIFCDVRCSIPWCIAATPKQGSVPQRLVYSILLFMIAFLSLSGVIVGLVGNNFINIGLQEFFASAQSALNNVITTVNNINFAIEIIPGSEEAASSIAAVGNAIVGPSINYIINNLFWAALIRGLVAHLALLLGLLVSALAISASLSRLQGHAISLSALCIVVAFMMLICCAIHLPLSLTVDDMCATSQAIKTNGTNPDETAFFYLYNDIDNVTYLSAFEKTWKLLQITFVDLDQHAIKALPGYSGFNSTLTRYPGAPLIQQVNQASAQVTAAIEDVNANLVKINKTIPVSLSTLMSWLSIELSSLSQVVRIEDHLLVNIILNETLNNACYHIPNCVEIRFYMSKEFDCSSFFMMWISNVVVCFSTIVGVFIAYFASRSFKQPALYEDMVGLDDSEAELDDIDTSFMCFDDSTKYSSLLTKAICIIQILAGAVQLARLDWNQDVTRKWEGFSLNLTYMLAALLGYGFLQFRTKVVSIIFGIVETVLFLIVMLAGALSLVEIQNCSEVSSTCTSYILAGYVLNVLARALDAIILLLGAIFSFKQFSNEAKIKCCSPNPDDTLEDISM